MRSRKILYFPSIVIVLCAFIVMSIAGIIYEFRFTTAYLDSKITLNISVTQEKNDAPVSDAILLDSDGNQVCTANQNGILSAELYDLQCSRLILFVLSPKEQKTKTVTVDIIESQDSYRISIKL